MHDVYVDLAAVRIVLSQSKVVVLILPGNKKKVNMIPPNQDQNMHKDSELSARFLKFCSLGC